MNYKLCIDPGSIMDMYFVFVIYFNQESWDHIADNPDDLIYYKKIVSDIGKIDPRCAVFFKQQNYTMSFFSRMILTKCLRKLGGKIVIADIQNALSNDKTDLRRLMWDFWTNNAPMPDNIYDIERYISDNLNCDRNTKQLLIDYFKDPVPYNESLKDSISDKYSTVLAMRKKQEDEAKRYIDAINADPALFLQSAFESLNCAQLPGTQYVSFCLLHRKIIYVNQSPNIILLGLDYQSGGPNDYTADPIILAGALHNPDCINILMYIIKNGESSIHEISDALGVHLSTISYQLVVLDNAQIVTPRQTADTTFYRFRPGIVDRVIDMI